MAKIVWKPDGLYNLRSAPGVKADLTGRAERLAAACGGSEEGYFTSSQQGAKRPQGRWRATVVTGTAKAAADNARNNTLIRNLGSSGG